MTDRPAEPDFVRMRYPRAIAVFCLAYLTITVIAVDYAAFVAIEHPFSLDARDFYIEQVPWIYLIYAAVALSAALYVKLRARRPR